MSLVGVAKVFTGVVLALAILFFTGVAGVRYFMWRITELPPRPVFANDNPSQPKPLPPEKPAAPAAPPAAAQPPSPVASPTPTPTPAAATARVSQPVGLIVREGPSRDSAQVGGVAFEQTVTVLETSPDGDWQKIRVTDSGLEGWVKAGNMQPIEQLPQ